MKTLSLFCTVTLHTLLLTSCTSFLDEVPDRSKAVLTTVSQYEQLLNYDGLYTSDPAVPEFGTDIFGIIYATWDGFPPRIRAAYTWQPDYYEGNYSVAMTADWSYPYNTIYYANVVLDGLADIDPATDPLAYNEVKGHALFLRAYQHYWLSQVYGQPYRPSSAGTDLGIPLKLSSTIEQTVSRATVAQTFARIIADCEEALVLLPKDYQAVNDRRAAKATVHAFLSRVYLIMQDYPRSLEHANACLERYGALLDYNRLAPSYQFAPVGNPQIIYYSSQAGSIALFMHASTLVDPVFYGSYAERDLRKRVLFRWNADNGTAYFNTLYTGTTDAFSGLSTPEVYLNRAECLARSGQHGLALADINHLLAHRYETGHFTPMTLDQVPDMLAFVLEERKKELVAMGTRWADLRRLNQDPHTAVTIRRTWDEAEHVLLPNDPRYTYPIPEPEVILNKFIQNPR